MLNFWIDKLILLVAFTWWGEWGLVREEWNLTYTQSCEAQARADEINRDAAERLLQAIQEDS